VVPVWAVYEGRVETGRFRRGREGEILEGEYESVEETLGKYGSALNVSDGTTSEPFSIISPSILYFARIVLKVARG
jgi:hypothetical protein